jgi:hypothetical protein
MPNSYQLLNSANSNVKVTVPNLTANGNILTAPTSVDIAQILEFNQTTASITGTLLNPTIATNYYEISVVNNGTADITLASTGDSFVILANKIPQKIAWSGTASSVWKLVNSTQVSAEGFEILNPFTSGATTASLSYVDCPGTALINIPSAGTWEIGYWANVVSSTVNAATNMCIAQTSGTALQGTESVWQTQTTNATGTVTGQKEVTTTGPATYRVQWKCLFGTSSRIGYSGGTNDMSRIWCRKVSGFSPVTGQSVDYVSSVLTGSVLVANGGNIPLTTVNGNIPNTAGVFTLQAGKTYRLTGGAGYAGIQGSTGISFIWRNITGAVNIGNFAGNSSPTVTADYAGQTTAEAIITPTVTTQVALTNISGSGRTIDAGTISQTFGTIVQLGTSAIILPFLGVATIGDAKSGFQTADHAGWIKLDGRLKTALTTTQQANATALGIGANLPDATGRAFTQGTLLTNIGSSTIAQTDLPNVTLTTIAGGNHTHSYLAANGSATLGVGSGSRLAGEISIRDNTATTTGTGSHTHTAALNGGVTQTAYTPASIGVNQFIYLAA